LGIASELWDPRFIKKFLAARGREMMVEHQSTKKRRKHWMRTDDELRWPWKDVTGGSGSGTGSGNGNGGNGGGIAAKSNASAAFAAQRAKVNGAAKKV
jgi:hypothetical protein